MFKKSHRPGLSFMQITKLLCKRAKENTAEIWRALYLAAWKDYYRLHHKLKLLELKEEDFRPSLASPGGSHISVNKPLSVSALVVKKCFWNRGVCFTTLFCWQQGWVNKVSFLAGHVPFSLSKMSSLLNELRIQNYLKGIVTYHVDYVNHAAKIS